MTRSMHGPARLGRAIVLGLAVVADFLVLATPAGACSCGEMDLATRLPDADGAFVGTYVDRDPLSDGRAAWTFDVERVVKGPFGPTAIVRTSGSGASCGIELFHPRTGLLLDRASDGVWEASLCQQVPPNQLLAFAQEGHPPDPMVAPIGTAWSIGSRLALVAALMFAALLVIWWTRRRRRSSAGPSPVT